MRYMYIIKAMAGVPMPGTENTGLESHDNMDIFPFNYKRRYLLGLRNKKKNIFVFFAGLL